MQPLQDTPNIFFDALKPENEKSYIFLKSGILKIHVRLFENFQSVITLQV